MIYKYYFSSIRCQDDQDPLQKDSCGQLLPSGLPSGDIDDLIFGDDEYYISQR